VKDDQLGDALLWLYATDCGLVGCAGHEAALRTRCRRAIWDRLTEDDAGLRRWISRLVRDIFLSEPALEAGHGVDDACEFWSWFDQTMWTSPPRRQPPVRCLGRVAVRERVASSIG
jgi:hypothetical protein